MSALCQRCALCCDGELFATVPLAPAEVRALRKLVVLPATDVLPQPCVALRELRCTIYLDRPDTCRRYRCMLLAALDAGEVSLPEAEAVVTEARARLAVLAADLPPGDGPVLGRARRAGGDLSPETSAQFARASQFLERRFRGHTRR